MTAILGPAALVKAAKTAPCPACRIIEELKRCGPAGAWTKATTLRKSKQVRAAFVHKCERGQE